MIPKELRGLTARELVSALEYDGFVLRRTAGSHRVYRHRDGRRVIVAMHAPGATFPAKTLASIFEATRWSSADFWLFGEMRAGRNGVYLRKTDDARLQSSGDVVPESRRVERNGCSLRYAGRDARS